ncbi:hypothetical protein PLESTB_000903000 [Pleodorina starrii]|uniref:Uncharacterized protein n=1 Tax=Pleodorina starrii TaxID=330485 RepID=A0A9W6BMF0_9CHLO|nr:hypothetical protein PLESTM_001514400 [Pleodorina starrii]GLC54759.1 hypothetical protein PLESTB_000903000 [Pleodorina starrii]GLC68361.1 hypothetical protein PLESTF_000682900 [Pleodorina starrii]
MNNESMNGVDDRLPTHTITGPMKEPCCHETVDAAGQQPAQACNGDDSACEPASTSASAAPPPGYRLVTVRLQGQSAPAVEDLPVEVLPCHTFADVCALALARLPDAPREYGLQAYLVLGSLEVPLEDPHTPARDALRSFAADSSLRFLVDPAAAGSGAAARIVRVSPLATPQRRRRQLWLRRLARVAIGVAKFVLAVEMAALLRGGLRGALRRLTGRGGSSSGSGDGSGGLGSETEAVMDAVANYVSGRGDISALQRFDPRVIRNALEAMDTEVLEQLDVPDVAGTRTAVSEVLRQIQKDEQDAAAAAAAATAPPVAAEGDAEAGPGPAAAAADGEAPAATAAGGEDEAGEGSAAAPQALPGFGPVPAAATGAGSGGARSRGR